MTQEEVLQGLRDDIGRFANAVADEVIQINEKHKIIDEAIKVYRQDIKALREQLKRVGVLTGTFPSPPSFSGEAPQCNNIHCRDYSSDSKDECQMCQDMKQDVRQDLER